MKNLLIAIFVLFVAIISAQTSCQNAQPFCTGGVGGLTFPATVNGPPAQVGPDYGCLGSQPNPAWYYLQVSQSGNLIISIAGNIGGGPGQDVDFICWGPFNSLANVCNSLTAGNIVDCSYSANYTETCTIPNAIVGQYYMVLITNYANVVQNIDFNQIGGTGATNCALLVNNSNICAGSSATIVANNQSNLSNPSYSLNPGGLTSPNPTFVVSPTVTTNYTIYVTGTNNQNAVVTVTALSSVTVNPKPIIAPTFTQATCTNSVNGVNLNLTFNPPNPVPGYTITWNPVPPGAPSPTQTIVNNIGPGTTSVLVTAAGGCTAAATFTMGPILPPVTFSITNLSGSGSITCTTPTVNLTASSAYSAGTLSYSWTSPSFTANTPSVSLTAANNLTLTGIDPATGCSFQQTISIGINTTVPTSTVSPLSQAITCNSATPITFTGTISSPTVNIQMDWYSPLNPLPGGVPFATSGNSISICQMPSPGIYTMVATDLLSGCKVQKTVTVTSLDAWPTFSVGSTSNFSIGCTPLNQTTLSIVNPISTQTPVAATCSYTFLPPGFAGTLSPGPWPAGPTSTVTSLPGTWTLIVMDNSNSCKTILSVPIVQNTVSPDVAVVMSPLLTQTLTCFNPTLLATGTTTTPNTTVQWIQPVGNQLLTTSTVVVGPGTGPNTSTTSLFYANYIVVATNSVNACKSTLTVAINQNFKPPVSSPLISVGTPTAIYCNVGLNPAVITTGASTITSGVPNAFVANPCWAGPSPQPTICGASSYSAYVPGVYSLTVMDSYNGCKTTGTVNVLDKTQPPVISRPVGTSVFDCGKDTTTYNIVLTGSVTGGVRYLVKEYPIGTAFTPTSANIFNVNPILSGTSSSSISVSKLGTYIYIVSNTLTGCTANGTFNVVSGNLTANFDANPSSGFAPLAVSFNNHSQSSSGSSSITSIWSYGNGTTTTTHSNEPTSTVFNAPGTYTVMLLTSKGNCLDTVYKIVTVDIPSKLEVPNVFTPNGDGSNDLFFVKAANLSEINATIFDRWGNKVYEVDSQTGNIGWDGKNQNGKECSQGVYFYIIKATGRDGASYNTKGNVSLFR